MIESLPVAEPVIDETTRPFWEGVVRNELMLCRCTTCREVVWTPRPFCPAHMTAPTEWFPASGKATVYSFTEVHRGEGSFAAVTPYVLAYVELAEGPRILTNIVGRTGVELRIGQRVMVTFDHGEAHALPRFIPA